MKPLIHLLFFVVLSATATASIVPGAERTELYLPLLEGKRVGILTNQTGRIGERLTVDSLLACGVDIRLIFAPEHGFRGTAGAGEHVTDDRDPATGLEIVSLYGKGRMPRAEDISRCDVILFDLQDVGLRYYTYLSTLYNLMQACAAQDVTVVVLDRPNPNGMYVDGPILDTAHCRSFVGMVPVPVVHGMTLGELARMINGEGWLPGGSQCDLRVIPCAGYTHASRYELPVRPSPNLPNMRSIYLYPSLCYFEGTPVSVGRGTPFPFQVYGHPDLEGDFQFTPRSMESAPTPPQQDMECQGRDLGKGDPDEEIIARGIDLSYVVDCWRQIGDDRFFRRMFDLLIGVEWVRPMIEAGASATAIESRWQEEVKQFRKMRKPYLLYDEE